MAIAESEIFEDEFPLVRSCPVLNDIRLAEEIKDLTIEVQDGAVLHAHRIILAARIPCLRESLSGARSEQNTPLSWPTVPLSVATLFVNYVYTGQVELTQANVRDVVMFARIIKLPVLENWGQNFMANRVTFENLATTWDFASSLNIDLLTEKCLSLMRQGFEEFVTSELFLRMPADTVLTLLRSDYLSVGSEEQVIGAISHWVCSGDRADDEKVKVHAPAMLKEVQWHQTTYECRSRLMERYPIFQKSPECFLLVFQIVNWLGAAEKDKTPCPFNVRPRQTHFFLFGRDKDDQSRWTVQRYDPRHQRAQRVADMEARQWATFSVVGESVFVVGGDASGQDPYSKRVSEFLVKEARWRERAPLAVGRRSHAAAVVKTAGGGEGTTLLGVFGGINGKGELSSCEVYDVNRDRWFNLPNMREKRNAPAAACLPGDSRVFFFGGFNGSSFHASVEFYRLEADWEEATVTSARTADFWQAAAPMRTARYAPAATPFRGRIIVAGGENWQGRLNVVEMFTPPDIGSPLGQWTELTDMKQHRTDFTLLTSADAVFALGGGAWGSSIETLTPPATSVDSDNDLTSWVWSSKDPVETLNQIWGAANILMETSAFSYTNL